MARKSQTPPTNDKPEPEQSTALDLFGGDIGGDIAVFNPAEITAGLGNLVSSIGAAGGIGGGMSFLGLGRDGVWAYGADKTECEPDAHWALDTRTLKHGFAAWREGKLVREVMMPISQPAPVVTSLPDCGTPYAAAFSVEMRCMDGEDKGTKVLYKTNSVGGRSAFAKLVEQLIGKLRGGSPAIFPVVLLKKDSYNHKEYGKIYTPILHVVKWLDVTGKPEAGAAPVAPTPSPTVPPAAAAAQPGVRRRRVEA
jgi:hypothetical protein